MDFSSNKTSFEVIKEYAFWRTYFKHIYFLVNSKWYKKSCKESDELKNIDWGYYSSNYDNVSVNK